MEKLISSAIGKLFKKYNDWYFKMDHGIMTGTVDLLDTNLSEIAKYYAIFLAFSGALVVAVVLARIITTMLKEADDTTDAT